MAFETSLRAHYAFPERSLEGGGDGGAPGTAVLMPLHEVHADPHTALWLYWSPRPLHLDFTLTLVLLAVEHPCTRSLIHSQGDMALPGLQLRHPVGIRARVW